MKISKCNKCILSLYRNKIVNGDGKIPADIMIIGEAPGFTEDKKGLPFVGKSGNLLRDILDITENIDYYITNIVKCRPPQNREPEKNEIDKCFNYLVNEIKEVKPKVIILLGNIAVKTMLGEGATITPIRKKDIQVGNKIVFVTYHPSYILRNNNYNVIIEDFNYIFNYYKNKFDPSAVININKLNKLYEKYNIY